MKVFSVALTTLILAHSYILSSALKYGIKGITKPCLADTDPHYDESIGYALKDQDAFWAAVEGLYLIESSTLFDSLTDEKVTSWTPGSFPEDGSLGTYDRSNNKGFLNATVSGSRFYYHEYRVATHNGDQSVTNPMPDMILPIDALYVSTFEKDGTARLLGTNAGFQTEFTAVETVNNTIAPVSGNTVLGLDTYVRNINGVNITFEVYQTVYCFDEACSKSNQYREKYVINPVTKEKSYFQFYKAAMRKVTEQEWFEAMDQVFTESNLPDTAIIPAVDNPYFKKPFDPAATDPTVPECFGGACPSEEDWRTYDPVYGTSPYVEPPGVLTGGFIAFVSVASIIIAIVIFFLIYKVVSKKREKHLRYMFATRIAENIEIEGSPEMVITADALKTEFELIDASAEKDGSISREELWSFMTSGKIGTMSESDFDILFHAIDLDKSGTINFLEFCVFISICGTEMQHAVSHMKNAFKESKDAKISRASAIVAHNNFRKSQKTKNHPGLFEDDLVSLVTEEQA